MRRVLVVDDHAVFRAAVRSLLDAEGFEVVGEAPTGIDALASAARVQPDVVLLDVQLPDMDGFEVARLLAEAGVRAAIVLVSSRPARTYGARLAGAHVQGFLQKSDLGGSSLREVLGCV